MSKCERCDFTYTVDDKGVTHTEPCSGCGRTLADALPEFGWTKYEDESDE